MRRINCLALVLVAAACGQLTPGTVSGGGTTPITSRPEPRPDAGTDASTPDGGTTSCPGDPDAAHLTGVALSEIANNAEGFVEFANETGGSFSLTGLVVEGAVEATLQGTLDDGARGTIPAVLPRDGELALRDGGQLVQYVCWGVAPISNLQNEAVSSGLWLSGLCAPTPANGETLHLRGIPTSPVGWVSAPGSPRGCP